MENRSSSTGGAGSLAATASYQSDDHARSNANPQVTPLYEFGYRVAERFGIPVVLLVVVLWWVRNDLVQPLLDAHFTFLGKVTTANERHTEELQNIGQKIDTLIKVSERQ